MLTALVAHGMSRSGPGHLSFGAGSFFATDPDTATVLPGGERTNFRLAFLTKVAPVSGLSTSAWAATVGAFRADYARHGDQVDAWRQVRDLNPQPVVTRPAKALRDHSRALGSGLIALPVRPGEATLLGFVDGRWGWIAIDREGDCEILLGPDVADCSRRAITDREAFAMAEFDPAGIDRSIYLPANPPARRSDDGLSFLGR